MFKVVLLMIRLYWCFANFIYLTQEDRENILRARATGKAVLTSPFRLLGSHHLGVVLTFPVYKFKLAPNPSVEQRIEATAGYAHML